MRATLRCRRAPPASRRRQREPEGRALADLALHADLPVVRLDDRPGDGEAEPETRLPASTPHPALEDARMLLGRDPGTAVGDRELHRVLPTLPVQDDLSPRRRELDRVPDDVSEDAQQVVTIALDRRQLLRDLGPHRQMLLL